MIGFSVKEAVARRYSVRSYDKKSMDSDIKNQILEYASLIKNPLGPKIRVQFIEKETAANGEKLGTYGIIKGAGTYLGVTVPDKKYAMEAVGYEFEQLVLYATSLGLGTCWLGGTFNRSAFSEAMKIEAGELFPILSPIGYPAKKKSFTEQIMRRSIKADDRKEWKELFYKNEFSQPLLLEDAGRYAYPLEMLRLAPSAVNKQPWCVVVSDNGVHFFEKHTMKSEGQKVDMQRIDVGIGICHFHLALLESGETGHFERMETGIEVPDGMSYIVSWVND